MNNNKKTNEYSDSIVVSCSVKDVYKALTSDFSKWWTPNTDVFTTIGDTIKFRFDDTYWVMRATELSLNFIELECIEAHHIVNGLPSSILKEWEGTKLKWKIQEQNEGLKISFTHEGLTPSLDCFEICEEGWNYFFVTSLKQYLNEGIGSPFQS